MNLGRAIVDLALNQNPKELSSQTRPLGESWLLVPGRALSLAVISLTDELVFKSIDESLAAVPGLIVRDAVYLRLLTKYSITREEILKHLDTFQTMLEDCFGPGAGCRIYKNNYVRMRLLTGRVPRRSEKRDQRTR